MHYPSSENEQARLNALRDYDILDTLPEAAFDDFTRLAAHICDTPIALISLIDADRQWFKSKIGIDADETSRDLAFCAHAIQQPYVFQIPDASQDGRFFDNPLVTGDPNVRFYAGAPLITPTGQAVGTLCVLDRRQRILTAEQENALQSLSRRVVAQMELRRQLAEREKAEKALRASEARKAAIVATALDCIITIDGTGRIVEWNPAAEWTFGYLADEAIGQDIATLIIPPALRDAHRQGFARYLSTGEGPVLGKRIEVTAMRASGAEFAIEMAITPLHLEGELLFTACLRDISDRQRAEEALRQAQEELEVRVIARTAELTAANAALHQEMAQRKRAEQNYHSLFENAVEGIFQVTPGGRYLSANPALARMYGYASPEELILSLTNIERQLYVRPNRRADFVRHMQQGSVSGFESEIYREDGTVIWISETAHAVHDETGVLMRYEGTVENITERRYAEEALRESEQRYRSLVEHSPEGIVVYSDSRLVYLNGAALRLFGAESQEQLLGRPVLDVVHPDWRDIAGERARFSQQQGQGSSLAEFQYLRLDGSAVDVEAVSTAILFNGKPAGQVLIRDITDRKRAEQQIYRLHDQLTQAYDAAVNAYDATIEGWSRALDYRDHETDGHSRRVTELTLRLARAQGLDEEALIHVRRGALLHDIGKMAVPDRILLKPGPLTDDEWVLMRRHPEIARDMLGPIAFLRPALDIPYCHHEKWDGTGYPCGLRGEEIPHAARLFAIVDVWDALRSDRPYRAAWPAPRVLDHLRCLSGTHFDPQVVQAFLVLMEEEESQEPVREEWALAA